MPRKRSLFEDFFSIDDSGENLREMSNNPPPPPPLARAQALRGRAHVVRQLLELGADTEVLARYGSPYRAPYRIGSHTPATLSPTAPPTVPGPTLRSARGAEGLSRARARRVRRGAGAAARRWRQRRGGARRAGGARGHRRAAARGGLARVRRAAARGGGGGAGGRGGNQEIKLLASAGSVPHDSIPYNPTPPRPRHALQ